MARSGGISDIPKTHTIRKTLANEVYHLLFTGKDKNFKKGMVKKIDDWLAQGDFFFDENPAELAREWRESGGASD